MKVSFILSSFDVEINLFYISASGRPIEIMRESSPQSNKAITPGYVRVIISDRTGRVLYTPILQPN